MDAERAKGNASGLLHGVPILLKNNIATLDRLNTTAGSFALLGATVPRDSTVVAKLRAAGAIILGKANMSQWASWRGSSAVTGTSINGWSAHGGQCQGVYYPGQDPSGSSSGSAVATALGLSFATLGSETDGSLILPGQASNVVAIKPTVGLTSRSFLIPVSPRQDTIGPIARTVKDAATILQTIAGRDSEDNYTFAQPPQVPDFVSACNLSALSGARIGVPRNIILSDQGADLTSFNAAIKTLSAAGATIVDNINITDYALSSLFSNTAAQVLNTDFVSEIYSSYLSKLISNPHNIKSVVDLRNFTHVFPQEDYHNFPQMDTSHWDVGLALGYNNTSPEFWANYQTNLEVGGRQSILGLLSNYSLDALIAPTSSAYALPALVGTPVVNVPLGFDDNDVPLYDLNGTTTTATVPPPTTAPAIMGSRNATTLSTSNNNPIGISFMGVKWSEEKLIGYAYAFEQRTKAREKSPLPYVLPKTQLVDVMAGSQNASNASAVANSNMALGGARI